jgi:hypothetical protein
MQNPYRKGLAALLLAALVALFAPSAQSQSSQEVDPQKTTRVTLGNTSGTPSSSVVVPIYFTPAEGKSVGSLKMELTFVSRNVKFSKLEIGFAAESGGVALTATPTDGKNDQGLEITTLAIEAKASDKPIPSGLLGYLTFSIGPDARPASISLTPKGEGLEIGTGTPVADLRFFEAKLEVLAEGTEPLVTCFFFTH